MAVRAGAFLFAVAASSAASSRAAQRQLRLSHRRDLGGVAVGGSGVFRLSGGEAAAKLQSGLAAPSDLLLVSGAVEFERAELAGMLSAGEARLVLPDSRPPTLWERAWSLTEDTGEVGDGTEVWWLASQPKGDRGGAEQLVAAAAPCETADAALEEWVKWFARGG